MATPMPSPDVPAPSSNPHASLAPTQASRVPAHATPTPPPVHPMVTRARAGVFKPNTHYAMAASVASTTISPIPSSARAALCDSNWKQAMDAEFKALQANRTWCLVDKPAGAHVISGKWVFKHKLHPDGSLEHYKARWVVREFTQCAGVDF